MLQHCSCRNNSRDDEVHMGLNNEHYDWISIQPAKLFLFCKYKERFLRSFCQNWLNSDFSTNFHQNWLRSNFSANFCQTELAKNFIIMQIVLYVLN
jgi:hypothetical protein